jgi:hypothetical protein
VVAFATFFSVVRVEVLLVVMILDVVFGVVFVGFAVGCDEALSLTNSSACLQLEIQPLPQNSEVIPHLPA